MIVAHTQHTLAFLHTLLVSCHHPAHLNPPTLLRCITRYTAPMRAISDDSMECPL